MEGCLKNREVISSIGDVVETLFDEMENLPLSDPAKQAMVMVMLGDLLHRKGNVIYFSCPPELRRGESLS